MKKAFPLKGLGVLCALFGWSRQAFYEHGRRLNAKLNDADVVIEMVQMLRKRMPRLGTPRLYHLLKYEFRVHGIKMGRDLLHELLLSRGMTVRRKRRRYARTTFSNVNLPLFPDLAQGMELTGPEQLWVADITYISLNDRFCYLSLVSDAYSRRIMGWHLHPTLETEGCEKALHMAISNRAYPDSKLVHHSDRGFQYRSQAYLQALRPEKGEGGRLIESSMTQNSDPRENPIAERINGLLKHDFGMKKIFPSLEAACGHLDEAINIYNNECPHGSIEHLRPAEAHQRSGPLRKKWKSKPGKTTDAKPVNA